MRFLDVSVLVKPAGLEPSPYSDKALDLACLPFHHEAINVK
jgi:hypothetical protein